MRSSKKASLAIIFALLIPLSVCSQPYTIYVSQTGNNQNPGTEKEPLQSIMMAQRKAREMRRLKDSNANEGITIVLSDGVHRLHETLWIRSEDAGTESSPTIFTAAYGASPVISGGTRISGWNKLSKPVPGLGTDVLENVWVTDVPHVNGQMLKFRQLWVNGLKAIRASSLNNGELDRIISVDTESETFLIPNPEFSLGNTDGLEFVIHQWWAIANLRVKNIEMENGIAKISFHQPESRIEFEHPWPAPFLDVQKELNGNSAFYFVNSLALLDSPGEWYEDTKEGKVYYWPRKSEDLQNAEIIVPHLEKLISIEGNLDNPVSHITFNSIGFEHTGWLRPSIYGHVPLQAGMFFYDAYKLKVPGTPDKASLENLAWTGRQPAGVEVKCATHIDFSNCTFRHMAATGLDYIFGTQNATVEGCIVSDIGGTGVQAGYFGGLEHEAHLPYDPEDKREICSNINISNNLVTNVTNEDWGCVGIGVGYASDISIEHNEISHVNYSGISVGWGWTRTINCMKNNRIHGNHIHHFAKMMYDVGGVYTLSAQPNTEISENSIHHLEKAPYAHIPEHYQYIYLDEGSSYIRISDNWTEKDKFFSNTPGPGNEWINNGPQVDETIREKAGLLPEYRHLLKEYKIHGVYKMRLE